ncbi:MAG: hypothetical protein MRY21_08050 [Simkaniaceae bacterium]|nr:hypothetical protein [Simkaniaceae bacterium]
MKKFILASITATILLQAEEMTPPKQEVQFEVPEVSDGFTYFKGGSYIYPSPTIGIGMRERIGHRGTDISGTLTAPLAPKFIPILGGEYAWLFYSSDAPTSFYRGVGIGGSVTFLPRAIVPGAELNLKFGKEYQLPGSLKKSFWQANINPVALGTMIYGATRSNSLEKAALTIGGAATLVKFEYGIQF